MSTETPKPETLALNPAEAKVPTVEVEGSSRANVLAAYVKEKIRREAFVREGGVIVEEPGIANQEAGAVQSDREVAEGKEAARREKFFADLVAKFPELTDVQREAVRATMEREKTRTWSDYDGDNVQIRCFAVEGNLLTIVVNVEDMYTSVHEKVNF